MRERTNQKYILLEGFGNSAKISGEDDQLALRQMDEFFCIEKCLGEVAGVLNLTYVPECVEVAEEDRKYIEFAAPVVVAKVAKPADGEDGEEGEEAGETPAEENAEKVDKFQPRDFTWTITDKKPQSLA